MILPDLKTRASPKEYSVFDVYESGNGLRYSLSGVKNQALREGNLRYIQAF